MALRIEDAIKELEQKINETLDKAGKVIERDAKANCYGVFTSPTGELARSINTQLDEKEHICYIGSPLEYAPYVEIGTGIYSSQGDGRQTPWKYYSDRLGRWVTTEGQSPVPFLRPAVEKNKETVINMFKGIL